MFRGFWALKITPGHTYTQTVDASFRVSNAALGLTLTDEQRTSVVATVDGKDFVLCSLTPGKIEQQPLDLWMTEGEEITFESNGNNEIHLTGNFVYEDEEDEDEDGPCDFNYEKFDPAELQEMVAEGLIDPNRLLDLASSDEEEEDEDYDSEDAEVDDRIIELTAAEEQMLEDEGETSSSDNEEVEQQPKKKPVKEVKIKKQAEKKRKEAEAEEEDAEASAKKAKKEKKEKAVAPLKLQGGVVAEVKEEGTGQGVKKGARVGMYYIGKLTSGRVFDKNVKGKPLWFRLGAGEVIKGWDVGIVGMMKGGERRLTIPAAMAYGKRGAPPDIPANATLVFDIRLVDFK
ncbi:peptidylprolyl isomerase fpr3 [Coemansia sp. RSA 2399]|nr:peptidylprolyl isomerase fpr3 [Coemansia sp. RSA 2399]KAJ1895166.1 peptidylprolyl isomerase fpr3 [Coemansia sp. IMI 209127]